MVIKLTRNVGGSPALVETPEGSPEGVWEAVTGGGGGGGTVVVWLIGY